jgi:hypothetical protein
MPYLASDLEKGLDTHASTLSLPPVPFDSAQSTPTLEKDNTLSKLALEKPIPPLAFAKPKRKTSRAIQFQLWFNTYRLVLAPDFIT